MNEIIFIIIFTIFLFFLDIYLVIRTKKTIGSDVAIAQGIYLAIIFILWILYCFSHLGIL